MKTSLITSGVLAGLVLASLTLPCRTEAALIAYEGFDYTSGDALSGQAGGDGWLAGGFAWGAAPVSGGEANATVGAGNLDHAGLSATGNHAVVSAAGAYPNRYIAVAPYGGLPFGNAGNPVTELWIGFLFQPDTSSFAQLRLSTFGAEGGGSIMSFGSSLGHAELGNVVSEADDVFVSGQTYFIAVQILFNTDSGAADTVHMYVNPTPGPVAPSVSAALLTNTGADISFERIGLVAGTSAAFDEIRIGTTFADIAPAVIPEPAAAGLMLCAVALSGAWFLRRRAGRVSASGHLR
ncbi:anchor protein [Opitutaceae bacterium TAV5]|nr:anchor protein [Opitutaceae bacterium TAV5]